MMQYLRATVVTTLFVAPTIAMADEGHIHFDLSPYLDTQTNKIRIDGLTHGSTDNPFTEEVENNPAAPRYLDPDRLVYELELEAVGNLGYIADPGLARDAQSAIRPDGSTTSAYGTGLRPTTADRLYVQFTRNLLYWDGNGFSAVPNSETLDWVIPGPNGDTIVAGTNIPRMGGPQELPWFSGDVLHTHLQTYLHGAGTTAPTEGVYLVTGQFSSSVSGVQNSDEFFVVYNFGASEDDHEAAVEWVQGNMVPEPASLSVLGLAAGALLRRRRKMS